MHHRVMHAYSVFISSFLLSLALTFVSRLANSDTMAAMGSGSASNAAPAVNILDLLAAQDNENARTELVRKHDTLKVKMDVLKQERQEQAKKKKALTKALKAANRAKARIVAKATTLSKEDLVAILCHKNVQEARKFKRLNAKSRTAPATNVEDDAPAAEESEEPEA